MKVIFGGKRWLTYVNFDNIKTIWELARIYRDMELSWQYQINFRYFVKLQKELEENGFGIVTGKQIGRAHV